MLNFKNGLLVATFALLSFGLEAATPIHTFSSTQIAVNTLPGEGIVHVIQGRNSLKVEIIVEGAVNLTVLDSSGYVVYNRNLNPQARRANINTNNYAEGVYTLIAEDSGETEEISFVIGAK